MTLDSIRDLTVCYIRDSDRDEGKWHVLPRADSLITACGLNWSDSYTDVNHVTCGPRPLSALREPQRHNDLCQTTACKNARRREVLAGW